MNLYELNNEYEYLLVFTNIYRRKLNLTARRIVYILHVKYTCIKATYLLCGAIKYYYNNIEESE